MDGRTGLRAGAQQGRASTCISRVRFAFGALGLEWDGHCTVTAASKEAKVLGVRIGWVVLAVNGATANDGEDMYDLLNTARRHSGWSAQRAQEFWETMASPSLETAVQHWPGDATERINITLDSLKLVSHKIGGEFEVCFTDDIKVAEGKVHESSLPSKIGSSSSAVFRTLNGFEYTVSFGPEETVRALRSRLAGLAGAFTDQVTIVLPNGTRLGEAQLRRDDARELAECGLVDGTEATLVVIAEPGDMCQERAVSDDLSKLIAPLKVEAQRRAGVQFQEFVPISYSTGLNPMLAPQHLRKKDLFHLSVTASNSLSQEVRAIIWCVDRMNVLGSQADCADVLADPHFVQALVTYDRTHVSESQANDIYDTLAALDMDKLGASLARFSPAAYILLRWVLAWLPTLVSPTLLRQACALQKSECIVKCRVGNGSYVHISVNCGLATSALHFHRLGAENLSCVVSGKKINDLIEWFPPQVASDLVDNADAGILQRVASIRRKSGAWR